MKEKPIIKIENLTKVFKLPHERYSTMKQYFVNILKPKPATRLKALDNISLEIKKGEFFGIIGPNGSGKSTLLKILAQIYQPTAGKIEIRGTLSPFIELGVGFNPELTARDNVFLNAAILGLSKKETEERFDEIIKFAELEEFVEQKLKNFSSGMQVRLAFSIAVQAKTDILLVDEVLAVGDAVFQQKCFEVFRKLKQEGKTIVFVSHTLETVQEFCDRVALTNKGKLLSVGNPRRVINDYFNLVTDKEAAILDTSENKKLKDRWGDGKVRIENVWIEDQDNEDRKYYKEEIIKINLKVRFFDDSSDPIFGVIIRREGGISVFESNSKWLKIRTGPFRKGEVRVATWEFMNNLDTGKYTISPAVAYSGGLKYYDWIEKAKSFLVYKDYKTSGFLNYRHKFTIK